MKHLRGYVFVGEHTQPFEMDVSDSQQAHDMLRKAGVKHYIFLMEREVEEDE